MESWKNPIEFHIFLGLGLLLILALLFSLFVFIRIHIKKIKREERKNQELFISHQKELLKANIETQEKERKRIAQNLHDNLIAELYRIKLLNEDAFINNMLNQGITMARNISHELSPPMLEQFSMRDLMVDFVETYQKKYIIDCSFNESLNSKVNTHELINIYRIFQEVITNIYKHAKANYIKVIWRTTNKSICLLIVDDGIGIETKKHKGMGLKNIESRVQILNGNYRIRTTSKGTNFLFIMKNNE